MSGGFFKRQFTVLLESMFILGRMGEEGVGGGGWGVVSPLVKSQVTYKLRLPPSGV